MRGLWALSRNSIASGCLGRVQERGRPGFRVYRALWGCKCGFAPWGDNETKDAIAANTLQVLRSPN